MEVNTLLMSLVVFVLKVGLAVSLLIHIARSKTVYRRDITGP